ncbi:hypothetical protein PENSPDRAFT_671416 [Peniophora sp. CONT]|nr:hypothetical protein PENSPDRAFT_671416 [Peniophora sp. CONT]
MDDRSHFAEKLSRGTKERKRQEDQENASDSDVDELDFKVMRAGIAPTPFASPTEATPRTWDDGLSLIGPRFDFEESLHPLTGEFPSRFKQWHKRPQTIISEGVPPRLAPRQATSPQTMSHQTTPRRYTPPPTMSIQMAPPHPSEEPDAGSSSSKGKGKSKARAPTPPRTPPPPVPRPLVREPSPMGPMDEDRDLEEMRKADRVAEESQRIDWEERRRRNEELSRTEIAPVPWSPSPPDVEMTDLSPLAPSSSTRRSTQPSVVRPERQPPTEPATDRQRKATYPQPAPAFATATLGIWKAEYPPLQVLNGWSSLRQLERRTERTKVAAKPSRGYSPDPTATLRQKYAADGALSFRAVPVLPRSTVKLNVFQTIRRLYFGWLLDDGACEQGSGQYALEGFAGAAATNQPMLSRGIAGQSFSSDVLVPASASTTGAMIRLSLPAIIVREYVRTTVPGATVRTFLQWMLQHGTPFGWAQPVSGTRTHVQRVAHAGGDALEEKQWARSFALAGGIGWRLALWGGRTEYAERVAEGPSMRARRHGEEFGWPADYVRDEAPGAAYDILAGRSGTFSLWPPQDVWDTVISNCVWSPAHKKWFQARLASLQGPAGEQTERAIGDAQWRPKIKYGVFPAHRQ